MNASIKTGCRCVVAAAIVLAGVTAAAAITPNPLISRGKTVKASNGTTAALVDGKFGAGAFTLSVNSWFAIDVGAGPTKVFITWNTTSYTWSDKIADPARSDCKQTPSYPVNYTIRTSANSTDGADGDWTSAATVTDNKVTARGHLVEFSGKRWVKMVVATSNRTSDKIDEVEVFNASNGSEDTWFFAGTSISANAYKSNPTLKPFSTIVNEAHGDFSPAMVRGGIPCITSAHFARDISMFLEAAGSCHYWAIEMGTNDAWGGTNSGVATFKSNLQLIIDSCKTRGIQPVIASVLATDSAKAGWQVNPDYAKAIADLTKSNNLVEGPDYFAAFKANPSYLSSDGVHPSAAGGGAMHKLWAEKMDGLFKTSAITPVSPERRIRSSPTMKISSGRQLTIAVTHPGTLSVFAIDGRLSRRMYFGSAGAYALTGIEGCVLLHYKTAQGVTTTVRVIKSPTR